MPRTSEQAEQRRRRLQQMIQEDGNVSVTAAAKSLDVSAMTIRRDLKVLGEAGATIRCYGGAVASERISFEFEFDERRQNNLAEKRRIGTAAAGRIHSGQTVMLDTGTTTLHVAMALVERNIPCTVITSSLVIASTMWGRERIELILLGGQVRHRSPDLFGPATEIMLDRLTADLAILGADAIDPARGCFCNDLAGARVAEKMAAIASKTVVVADHTKFENAGAARYLPIGGVDTLITGKGAAPRLVRALRGRGVSVSCQ
jgi:DeoR/GlpR family transcriptional regulator of sugar metabolism